MVQCLPSIDPKQLGTFHVFQKSDLICTHSLSTGTRRYSGAKFSQMASHTSLTIFPTVLNPTRKLNPTVWKESPVDNTLQENNVKMK